MFGVLLCCCALVDWIKRVWSVLFVFLVVLLWVVFILFYLVSCFAFVIMVVCAFCWADFHLVIAYHKSHK